MDTECNYTHELIAHLLTAEDSGRMEHILRSLLTPSELSEISKRLQIFKLLEQGMPQRQIAEKLGVGIATVTRGSRALKGD
ncbi:trp operon repressor [Dasania sp. GY-MA-18]|uniref:Trp operon repressor n=1 Tax=Dasania phycosphaerae TaxID=2950436 RepID=A0A9J6RK46_9GAMM|nr:MULTISPECIES: trp operon repressor [Dasania]MCR8922301.1 trp operon repressor [Dasania sp. GY-MA-18]MCZ0864729.1 trp operon repressor [Dasania phycosphaerae]MCZ0868457.1 trp operon repressor [Dasania phycosphaerae]